MQLNPNFFINESSLGKKGKPDFLVIGAAKAGTTSIYQYLVRHPQVVPSLLKEVGFFDLRKSYINGFDWYCSHFPQVPDGETFLTGEATPSYLNRRHVAERVFETLPDVKLIVILRNPVERTISAYYHSVKDNGEQRFLEEVIDSEIEMIQGMSDLSDIINTNFKVEPRCVVWSLYYYFLKKWTEVFPREQILILNSNEFYADRKRQCLKYIASWIYPIITCPIIISTLREVIQE